MAEAAEQAGFRPCRRYRPAEAVIQDPQGKKKHSICQFCFLLPIGLLPLMAPWRESESISISSQDDWNI
jgi:methylphosphotriester-DNA--protein-cysteine methyltransferase